MPLATQTDLSAVIEAAQMGWMGLLIDVSNWNAGVTLGSVGISTAELFPLVNVKDIEKDGNTGSGKSGFDNQLIFADLDSSSVFLTSKNQKAGGIGVGFLSTGLFTDQFRMDGNPSFASDCHTVESEHDSSLLRGQHATLSDTIVNKYVSLHSEIADDRTTIDNRTVDISGFDVRGDFASQGSDGAISDLEIFDLEELSLQSFKTSPRLGRLGEGFISPRFFTGVAAGLGQDEDQQNQSALHHSLSFGTLTIPPDHDVVNQSASFGTGFVGLTADQLALLNQATITIADLADGYLALTIGTTITLDTDAAGYGWFIDPTPLTNEEFAVGANPWQFTVLDSSAASGKMDLMTVLMHELGHVMGLGHVSSAVDGTRLMAGSIDPGIRRLPSSLDLGPVEYSHESNSELSTQNSAQQIWAPYLAHYTTTSDATPSTPLTPINPARLVQAAQLPSHAGIFNSNFGVTDPANAQFGWDRSGAVTIAKRFSPKTARSFPPCPSSLPCRLVRRTCALRCWSAKKGQA